ncbi:MAG: DUF2793 domain-containing protein [Pseudomonadota bacterium]
MQTENLGLPYIAEAQALKHVTHNEALRALDALVQLSVLSQSLSVPPASPAAGDRYIIADNASGAWGGQEAKLTAFQDGGWVFFSAATGWQAFVDDTNEVIVFRNGAWHSLNAASINPAGAIGVNTTADGTNKLAVKSEAVLFSHDDVTPGTGSIRHVINKSGESDTASLVFQSGFSGRAEFGVAGVDDFSIKVSPDGSTWYDALVINRSTGEISFPNTSITGGGGGAANTIYVNVLTGSDTNTGTSPAAPFETLSIAQSVLASGVKLSLARGATWREKLTLPLDDVSVNVFGIGTIPVINAADEATGWTATTGHTDVWEVSWARDNPSPTLTEPLSLRVDGSRVRFATDLNDLETNGGWWTPSRYAQTATVYLKSTSDPSGEGVTISRRDHGINAHEATTLIANKVQTVEGPLEIVQAHGHYSCVSGARGTQRQILARDGAIHHITTEADLLEDVICVDPPQDFSIGANPIVLYRPDASGWDATVRRAFIFGNGVDAADGPVTAFYSHGSGGTAADSITIEQFYAERCDAGVTWDVDTDDGVTSLNGLFTEECAVSANIAAKETITRYAVIRNPVPRTINNLGCLTDVGPVDTRTKTRLIEHSIIYVDNNEQQKLLRVEHRSGSLTLRNCLIVVRNPSGGERMLSVAQSTGLELTVEWCVFMHGWGNSVDWLFDGHVSSLTMDNNVYLQPRVEHNLGIGGGSQTLVRDLAAWQALGYDQNSVIFRSDLTYGTAGAYDTRLNEFFLNGLAGVQAGDFRIDPSTGNLPGGQSIAGTVGPQMHWDWNARAAVTGAPTRWPVVPKTLNDQRSYIANPTAWAF